MNKLLLIVSLALLLITGLPINNIAQNLTTCLDFDAPFDNSILDQGGSSYATTSSTTFTYTLDRKSNANSAVVFDGVDDFITLNGNSPVITGTSFSISAWVKITGTGGGSSNQNAIFMQRDDLTTNAATIGIQVNSSGTLIFSARKSGTSLNALVSTSITTNTWHHIAMTFSNTTLKGYLDGQLIGTSTTSSTGSFTSGVDYTEIGRHRYLGVNQGFFNGAMDDFKIFDCELTPADVQELYCPAAATLNQSDTLVSAGTVLQFYNSTANSNTSNVWTLNGSQVSTNDTLTQSFANTGQYQIIVSSTDGFCVDYDTVNVFVQPAFCVENGNLGDSIRLYSPLDGNALDFSGNNFNGIATSGLTQSTDRYGNANGSYYFNGTTNDINYGNAVSNGVRSVTMWFKTFDNVTTSTYPYHKALVSRDNGLSQVNNATEYYVAFMPSGNTNAGRISFTYFNNSASSYSVVSNSNQWTAGQWHHMAAIIDPVDGMMLYIDGQKQTNTLSTQTSAIISASSFTYVGDWGPIPPGQNRHFKGNIDDIRFYTQALSSAEVAALYCPAQVSILQNDTIVTSGTTLSFNSSCNNYPLTWSVNGTQVSTNDTLTQLFSSEGQYQIIVSSTDGYCTDYDTVNVSVQMPVCLESGDLNNGLQLYYPFNGNALDFSGNNHNGSIVGTISSTTNRYGESNTAYSFNGSAGSDYVNSNTVFDYYPRTISLWFYPTSLSTNQIVLTMDKTGFTSVAGGVAVQLNSNGSLAARAGGTSGPIVASNVVLNQWHHLLMVRTAGTNYYYYDGQLAASNASNTNSSATGSQYFILGIHRDLSSSQFNGKIDDVRVYNRALNSDEIEVLYCPSQVRITQNDTTIPLGTTLNFTSFCHNFPLIWALNGTQVSTNDTLTQTFSTEGQYQIIVSSTDGFCTDYDTVNVLVEMPVCLESGDLNNGLQLHYPFNGNALDFSGNNHNGTVNGGIINDADRYGNANSAFDFNGTTGWVNTATSFDYQNRTVSVWVRPDVTTGSRFFFTQDAASSLSYGQLSARVENGSFLLRAGGESSLFSQSASANQWYHLVLVRNNTSTLYYINGNLVGTSTSGTVASTTFQNQNLVIGAGRSTTQDFFNGKMDDLRVYNRQLSMDEINALYCPSQVKIQQNDTIVDSGTTLSFHSFCSEYPLSWYVNGTQVSTSDTLTYTFSGLGLHQVIVSSTDGFCIDYDTLDVRILPEPSCLKIDSTFKISSLSGNLQAVLDNGDYFGGAIKSIGDFNGDGVPDLVASAGHDDDGSSNSGAIYLLMLNSNGTILNHIKISTDSGGFGTGLDADDFFGRSVSVIGDLNQDGINELAVGALYDDDGGTNRGAVWILFIDSTGNVTSKQKISDTQGSFSGAIGDNDNFGAAVLGIPDINGDNVPDLIVGSPYANDGGSDAGSFWILKMNTNGTVNSYVKVANNAGNLDINVAAYWRFGNGLGYLGDIDNDGNIEIAVGAPGSSLATGNTAGSVFIMSINSSGVVGTSKRITSMQNGFNSSLQSNGRFGIHVSDAHDLDGDGYSEIIVSNWFHTQTQISDGAAWLISLDSSMYVFDHKLIASGVNGFNISLDANDNFGFGADIIGDINGDGLYDLAIGARNDDDGGADRGAFYLMTLRDTCCPLIADFNSSSSSVCQGGSITFTDASSYYISPTYSWYINETLVSTASSFSNTFPNQGTYQVKLVIDDSCSRSHTQFITVHPTAVADAGPSDFICFGDTVQLNASGGVEFQWSNSSLLSNDSIANPYAFPTVTSIFTVTVTDTNGCVDTDNMALIVNPNPVVSVAGDSLICLGDSTVLTASGTLSYTWQPTTSLRASSGVSVYAFPTATTTYILEGTDANGCQDTAHYTVMIDTSLHASVLSVTDALCFGSADGQATGQAIGGTLPYSYLWPNGSTIASANTLIAGTQTFIVSDIEGCVDSVSFSVGQPDSIAFTFNVNDVLCFGDSNGSITASVVGGTSGYTYAWSNSVIGSSNSNIPAGTYGVTVTDAHSCTNTDLVIVDQPNVLSIQIDSVHHPLCNLANGTGSATGQIYTTTTGGNSSYSYAWSNGATTANLSGLTAGTYLVTVTDGNGCSDTAQITLVQPDTLEVAVSLSNVSCFGFNDGEAISVANGGTSGYQYAWYTTSGCSLPPCAYDNDSVAQNLNPTNQYYVVATDANNCSVQSNNVSVTQPTVLSLSGSTVSPLCYQDLNGSATVTASGATPTYSYQWNTGITTSTLPNIGAGTFSVTVTDANGCNDSLQITVTEPALLVASIALDSNVSCFGGADASLTASASGGTTNYSYQWASGSTTTVAPNLSAGNYTVTVTDANGCQDTVSHLITEPTQLATSTSLIQNVSCFSGSDGQAKTIANNGTAPYQYAWSNGSTDTVASNLSEGTYYVTITDAKNCQIVDSIYISEPTLLTATTTLDSNVTCFGYANGIATANPSGGTSPYVYVWDNGETMQQADSLLAGTRFVTVTDDLGCVTTTSVLISQPTVVLAVLDSTKDVLCNGFYDGLAFTSATGGTGSHSFLWNTGDTIDDIDSLTSGTYIVTVYDSIGCFDTAAVTIIELTPVVPHISWTNVTCFDGSDGTATTAATGGGTLYSYTWNSGQSTPSISALVADTFIVHVTDEYNCNTYDTAFVIQPDSIQFSFDVVDISCAGLGDGQMTVSAVGGTQNYTFTWSTSVVDTVILV